VSASATASPTSQQPVEGRVKWYSRAKGYGFLVSQGSTGEVDVFVHHSALGDLRDLEPGERVRFHWVDAEKGPLAKDVERLP
jgi:cold shock protein